MSAIEKIHGGYVHSRRVRVLAGRLAPLLPSGATVLDVGCGDGLVDLRLLEQRPDLLIRGLESQRRGDARLATELFDGTTIPREDRSVDVVMFVDVLHHTDDPMILLREAARVSRDAIVIKDHLLKGFLAATTLRFMDRVGNKRFGVPLPHRYWSESQWRDAFEALRLRIESFQTSLGLYPWPASMVFDRSLHFIAELHKERS